MVKYAWRTYIGESNLNDENKCVMHWWKCADIGMENELVLSYMVDKTPNYEDTELNFKDKWLQKITASGKPCSGKVSEWMSIATNYNENGTVKS